MVAISVPTLVFGLAGCPRSRSQHDGSGAHSATTNVAASGSITTATTATTVAPSPAESTVFVRHDLAPSIVDPCDRPDVPADGATTIHEDFDLHWADHAGTSLEMDLARPVDAGDRHPLVIIVHGGGWSAGGRSHYRKDVRRLASIGFVATTIDYRLANIPTKVFPAGISDVRCAVRWLRAHASEHQIDPSRVVVVGASAGAHLAAMMGVERDVAGLDDGTCTVDPTQPVGVSGVVGYYGPYDLRNPEKIYNNTMMIPAIEQFLGVRAEDAPELATRASPIAHVTSDAPPFLLFHGVDDSIVPVNEARRFANALHDAGVPSLLVEVEGEDGTHGFPLFVTTRTRVTCTALAFLRSTTK
jgi:acetyl esterase/lipase